MQFSVETTSELGRNLTVEIPEQRVQELVTSRLNALARDAKIDGFRPGKVPAQIIKRQYGLKIREEVMNELLQSSLSDGLKQNNLTPISEFNIDLQAMDEGMGMKYVASFEIAPEFVLMPLESLEVTRYAPEVSATDAEEAIERLRNTQETWVRQDRPARMGDRVIVNFEGKVGEESVTDGRVENYPVILGGAEKIPGFDENIVGQSANTHLEFDVRFPEDYPKSNMAGKVVNFRLDLIRVEEREIPELNAEWIKSLGAEDGEYESLIKNFRSELEREMEVITFDQTKNSVNDALYAANPIAVPNSMVEAELKGGMDHLKAEAEKLGSSVDEAKMREVLLPQARRRVTLTLLYGHIVELFGIKLEKQHFEGTLAKIAGAFQNTEEVMQWYRKDENLRGMVERLAHENLVVDFILGKARVRDVIQTPRDVSPAR